MGSHYKPDTKSAAEAVRAPWRGPETQIHYTAQVVVSFDPGHSNLRPAGAVRRSSEGAKAAQTRTPRETAPR